MEEYPRIARAAFLLNIPYKELLNRIPLDKRPYGPMQWLHWFEQPEGQKFWESYFINEDRSVYYLDNGHITEDGRRYVSNT